MVLERFGNSKDVVEVASQVLNWYAKFQLMRTEKSWNDFTVQQAFSLKGYPGHQFLSWRNKGYKTILDVLMVSLFKEVIWKCFLHL